MDQVDFIPFAFPGVSGVSCVFTTRRGGAGKPPYDRGNLSYDVGDDPEAVTRNRLSLMRALGFSDWQELTQVHGADVVFDPEPAGKGVPPEATPKTRADGLATGRPGQALVVKTADCQPIMLAHESGRYVCALHCGWRGNRINFPAVGVGAFCEKYGLDPGQVYAVRGPSLCPAASEFTNFESEWGEGFRKYFNPETMTVDLWRMTRDQLVRAGLSPERIFSLDLCTYGLCEMFFSYRRDAATGRMGALVWIGR